MPRILVVYANPHLTAVAAPPCGAERVAQAFQQGGCETQLIVPFMHFHPRRVLSAALTPLPDLVASWFWRDLKVARGFG